MNRIEHNVNVAERLTEDADRLLWSEYERRKTLLPADLNDMAYAQACQRIAAELGL